MVVYGAFVATPQAQEWMTSAAIARRLGVGRAAVTNWRRRYPDFPSPTVHDGTSRFDWAEVSRWLAANGKGEQLARVGRTETGTRVIAPAEGPALPPVPAEPPVARPSPATLLARAMVSLLPPLDDVDDVPVVLDPACGVGDRLEAAADRYGDAVALVGRDDDESAITAARAALRTHPLAGPCDVEVGGALARGSAAAVVCVADPRRRPAVRSDGSGTDDAVPAWVRYALGLTRAGGVAVVAVPAASGAHAAGAATRVDLVRRGLLRTVVALPPSPDTPARCLWVLRQTAGRGDDVRMIDLSGVADPAELPTRSGAWHRIVDDADPAVVGRVPRVALLDGAADLTPARYVAPRWNGAAARLAELTTRLRTVYDQVAAVLPTPTPSGARTARDQVTVAELERGRALSIMVRDASPHPGDVVLRSGGRVPLVVEEDQDVPDGVVQILAPARERLDASFVALFLRPELAAMPPASPSGGPSRDDLRRCRLPRMPLPEQRRYGDAYRRLLAVGRLTTDLAGLTGSVLDQTAHGLTTGALLPAPTSPPRTEGDAA